MILCCGEALIDMLAREGSGGRLLFEPAVGGSVFNTAVGLGRLGARAGYFGGLSRDLFGDMLRAALEAAGTSHALSVASARPTTLAFVTLRGGVANYHFVDENTAGRMLDVADLPALSDAVQGLFFGGISLAVEPCASIFETLLDREGAGRLVMLDPNIRPDFISDMAQYRARLRRMIAQSDIVKLSDEDLRWMAGADDAEAAQALLGQGPALVIVTRGARGATAYGVGGSVDCPAPVVEVVDTVGAGDAFNAALLVRLQTEGALSRAKLEAIGQHNLAKILDFANRAAALNVARAGADAPWASEMASHDSGTGHMPVPEPKEKE